MLKYSLKCLSDKSVISYNLLIINRLFELVCLTGHLANLSSKDVGLLVFNISISKDELNPGIKILDEWV